MDEVQTTIEMTSKREETSKKEAKADKEEAKRKQKEKENRKKISFYRLFRFATPFDYLLLVIGTLAAMAAGSALPLSTKIFGNLVNEFAKYQQGLLIADEIMSTVITNVLYFVALWGGTLLATYIYTALFVFTGERQTHRLRMEYLKSVLRQDTRFYERIGAGEIISQITSDTLLVQDGISEKLSFFLMNLSTAIAAYVVAFTTSVKMTGVLFVVVPVLAIVVGVSNRISVKYTTKSLDYYAAAGTVAEETFSSIRTVVANGAEQKMVKKYVSKLGAAEEAGIKKHVSTGLGAGLIFFVMFCAYSLGFWYGGQLIYNQELGPGDVLNCFFAVLIGSFSIGHAAPDIAAFNYAMGAGAALFSVIDSKSQIDSLSDKGIKNEDVHGDIELKNVSFHYPSRPEIQVLKNINIKIDKAKTVAFVGASGSGKSTILQLIERFYDPVEGQILFDGKPINEYNIRWLRNQIGLVSQEPVLFSGTIGENVMLGLAGSADDQLPREKQMELVIEACKTANCHDFIMKLPRQYETDVGERGHLLSGGQKQRIAIARSIVKRSRVLLLDEATSALDTASERVVQEALDKASAGRTTIVVAHRLSTIKNADLIIVMQKGEIVEAGKHEDLMGKNDGYYKKLVELQQIRKESINVYAADNNLEQSQPKLLLPLHSEGVPGSDGETNVGKRDDEESQQIEKIFSNWEIFKRIMRLNSNEYTYIAIGAFSSIMAGLVFPLFAIVFGSILNIFSSTDLEYVKSETNKWALYFVGIACAALIFNTLQNTMFGLSGERLTTRIRSLLFETMCYQEIAFFDANPTGSLCAKLSTEALQIQGLTGSSIGTNLNVMTNVVAGIIVAFIYGPILTLVVMACIPLLIAASAIRMKILMGYNQKTKTAYEHSSSIASEAVAAIKTVQSLTMELKVLDRYECALGEPSAIQRRHAFLGSIAFAFSQSVNFLVNALIFWYGAKLIVESGYTIQNLFTVFMGIIFAAMGAGRAMAFGPDAGKAKDSARYILNLFDRYSTIDARKPVINAPKIDSGNANVDFKGVTFEYPTRRGMLVLRGVDFKVNPGETVALVGQSGCGKSTTIQLMTRFYDPLNGSISLDGHPINKFSIKDYRRHLSLVGQEPQLYTGTIRENILFGVDDETSVTQDQLDDVAREANILEFIQSLPDGYDTNLGQKGNQLSGGQKQRLAICRALIRQPKVLLLDEATSALDGESEKIVQQALDKASAGRTTIVIAHRLSTIQKANCINVFSDGKIVECGTHDQLLQLNGLYKEMVDAQNLEK